MKLQTLISEDQNTINTSDADIKKALESLRSTAERVGFKLSSSTDEFINATPTFKPSTHGSKEETVLMMSNGIINFGLIFDVPGFPGDLYKLVAFLKIRDKFSITENGGFRSNMISNFGKVYNVDGNGFDLTLKVLKNIENELNKLEEFFDWAFDITGDFKGIKFKVVNPNDFMTLTTTTFIDATAGTFNFS